MEEADEQCQLLLRALCGKCDLPMELRWNLDKNSCRVECPRLEQATRKGRLAHENTREFIEFLDHYVASTSTFHFSNACCSRPKDGLQRAQTSLGSFQGLFRASFLNSPKHPGWIV